MIFKMSIYYYDFPLTLSRLQSDHRWTLMSTVSINSYPYPRFPPTFSFSTRKGFSRDLSHLEDIINGYCPESDAILYLNNENINIRTIAKRMIDYGRTSILLLYYKTYNTSVDPDYYFSKDYPGFNLRAVQVKELLPIGLNVNQVDMGLAR